MKHIGIVGFTAEGAALCYKEICSQAYKILGKNVHPEISLHHFSFDKYFAAQEKGDWEEIACLIAKSIEKVKLAGADFVIIPANTPHLAIEKIKECAQLPLLSILEVVSNHCQKNNYSKVAFTGTRVSMSSGLYDSALKERGIETLTPDEEDQVVIDNVIFDEIIPDNWTAESADKVCTIIDKLKEQGAQAVILGCTELPLIITDENSSLPVVDTTRLLAKAALDYALSH